MQALSELFDSTTVLVPCAGPPHRDGELPLVGRNLVVRPLPAPSGTGAARKLAMVPWALRNVGTIWRETRRADAVHAPIPGDIGTIGMLTAFVLRKRLFVRHCGNWLAPRTGAERFWKWFMQRYAGGRNVMLATGGQSVPPSRTNPALRWIFSTTLSDRELRACAVARGEPGRRLLIACRQDPKKGTALVIDALRLVLPRLPDATLDVVGDGGALPALRDQAARLGVADRMTFHGAVGHDAVIRLMQRADVFCYPTSASEGFPKVVLEALACGLPVVATRVSAIPELLATGAGLLIDEPTPHAVADAVVECLTSPERYGAMSRRAVDVAAGFSLELWKETIAASLTAAWGELHAGA